TGGKAKLDRNHKDHSARPLRRLSAKALSRDLATSAKLQRDPIEECSFGLYDCTVCFGLHILNTEGAGSYPQFTSISLSIFAKTFQDNVRHSEMMGSFYAHRYRLFSRRGAVKVDHTAIKRWTINHSCE